ncbi:MAG: (E)-4-hydroxy-3-methylbut-2-enyl-diphosphate synthase [Bacteroidales bacterium]|nr:(E)-4-hydroxy-3-methylbut-2-enyl-diphosphate synthase [Bacteroidales bacterium]
MTQEIRHIICDVKGVKIGEGSPIVIQSMCNTPTDDVAATVAQCKELYRAGSQLIRITTPGLRDVSSLAEIKRILRSEGIDTPLVADVHFNADVALAAAAGVADKVRINPGNFSKDPQVADAKFRELIAICKEHGTALRIGLNHGSLGERITSLYGDTPAGMVKAVMEWLSVCVEEGFENVVVSLKASNTKVMADAYRLLYITMAEELGMIFPLHLGVTEAGNGDSGRIKSAVGIGTLLSDGIGNTIRVSLTENPVKELPVARLLADLAEREEFDLNCETWEEFIVKASYKFAGPLLDNKADDISLIDATIGGKPLTPQQTDYFRDELMQACRRKFTKPEYIACPSCGRTHYDIETVLAKIKEATKEFAGVKIAVMGCIVNGPGEMADADFGYVGEGGGKITSYKGKEPVMRGIPQENAVEKLLELIKNS